MKNALLYLALQSRANSLRALLLRLRQPRYAIGALLVAAYLWFFLLRSVRNPAAAAAFGGTWGGDFSAFLLFVFIVGGWILGGRSATLNFSEAEAAWLFPAPLSRRTLVRFKLLQTQLASLFTAFVFSALAIGGGSAPSRRFVGWWITLSFLQLHAVAGAFTRERLADRGLDPFRRRVALGVLLLGLALPTWLSARAGFAALGGSGEALADSAAFASALLATPPLAFVLAPFRLVVAPMHAASGRELLVASLPALALLAAHYLWAMRAIVGFEGASAAQAEKRATALRAMRGGQGRAFLRPRKAQSAPFALGPQGRPEIALLWQRLIAAGAWAFPRSLLAAAAIPIAAAAWMRGSPEWERTLGFASFLAAIFAAQLMLLGPALARRSLMQLFERIDVVKAYPLAGWQVVLGELLGPSAVLSALELTLLSVAALGAGRMLGDPEPTLALAGWIAAVALVPLFAGILFGAQLGVLLALPAWFRTGASGTPGLEQMGQQMVFMFVSLLAFIVALLPAGLAAAIAYFVAQTLTGSLPVSIVGAGLAGAAELGVEFAALVWWLGRRFDRLDLALDLAR